MKPGLVSLLLLPELALASGPGTRIEDVGLADLLDTETEVATSVPLSPRELPGVVTIVQRDEILRSGARDLQEVLAQLQRTIDETSEPTSPADVAAEVVELLPLRLCQAARVFEPAPQLAVGRLIVEVVFPKRLDGLPRGLAGGLERLVVDERRARSFPLACCRFRSEAGR